MMRSLQRHSIFIATTEAYIAAIWTHIGEWTHFVQHSLTNGKRHLGKSIMVKALEANLGLYLGGRNYVA